MLPLPGWQVDDRFQHEPAHRGALTSPAVYGRNAPVEGPTN